MKRIFTLQTILTLMFVGLLTINTNAQTWTIYDGSVLPANATPAWTPGDNGAGVYTIEDDAITAGNKLLKETTATAADKQSYKLNIAQPASTTWMIRVKAGANPTSTEFEINTSNGTTTTRCYFRLINNVKGGYLRTNYLTTNIAYPSDTALTVKEFHTYRITASSGLKYKIYLDENPTAIISDEGSTITNTHFLRFGDVGSNFTEGYIDWMAWDVTGAYAPGTTLPAGVIVDGVVTKINSAKNKQLNISPNPVTNVLTIQNADNINKYEIIGINGNVISKGINKSNVLSTNVSNLKTGIYFIKVYNGGKTEQIKFMKK